MNASDNQNAIAEIVQLIDVKWDEKEKALEFGEQLNKQWIKIESGIAQLEFLNIIVAIKTWAPSFKHGVVRVTCDNAASIAVLQHGRSRNDFLLECAREAWLLAAHGDFIIQPMHRPGSEMQVADALSRAHMAKIPPPVMQFLASRSEVKVRPEHLVLSANLSYMF